MDTTAVRRARRWFWTLTATAVLAMGALSHGLRSAPGPGTGILVLGSSLALAASAFQAARILAVLVGPPCLALRGPGARRRSAGGGISGCSLVGHPGLALRRRSDRASPPRA